MNLLGRFWVNEHSTCYRPAELRCFRNAFITISKMEYVRAIVMHARGFQLALSVNMFVGLIDTLAK